MSCHITSTFFLLHTHLFLPMSRLRRIFVCLSFYQFTSRFKPSKRFSFRFKELKYNKKIVKILHQKLMSKNLRLIILITFRPRWNGVCELGDRPNHPVGRWEHNRRRLYIGSEGGRSLWRYRHQRHKVWKHFNCLNLFPFILHWRREVSGVLVWWIKIYVFISAMLM